MSKYEILTSWLLGFHSIYDLSLKTSPKFHFYFSRWVFFTKKQNQLINATWLKSWKKCWENLHLIIASHNNISVLIVVGLKNGCFSDKKEATKVASRLEGEKCWKLKTGDMTYLAKSSLRSLFAGLLLDFSLIILDSQSLTTYQSN